MELKMLSTDAITRILAIATAEYGDDYDTDAQVAFSLVCDLARITSCLEADAPIDTWTDAPPREVAYTIGSVMENVAPGWYAGIDTAWEDTRYAARAVQLANQ